MKVHTTNYKNTFIAVADDSRAIKGEIPLLKGNKKTIANLQFEMISKNPYKFTSDEVLFEVYAQRNEFIKEEYKAEREKFFSKGQACFRASPLTKKYGWGLFSNENGKIALYAVESNEYQEFLTNDLITIVKAMKSNK